MYIGVHRTSITIAIHNLLVNNILSDQQPTLAKPCRRNCKHRRAGNFTSDLHLLCMDTKSYPLVPDEVGVTPTSPAITGERAAEPPTFPCNAWKPRDAPGFRRCKSYPYIDCNAWRAGSCTSDFNLQCKEAKSLPLAPDDVGVTPTSPATHTCRPTQST